MFQNLKGTEKGSFFSQSDPCRATAFSSLELLIVIALIFTLIALSLPAMSKIQKRARDLGCISNLSQWGKATQLYAAEHNDRLPKDGTPNGLSRDSGWYIDLPRAASVLPYHDQPWRTNSEALLPKSLWLCPSNPKRSNGNNLFHYCLNQHVNGRGTGKQADLSSIRNPVATIWMFDNGKEAAVAQQNNVHTNLHKNGAHFLFLDSHVAHHGNELYWDFTRNRGVTNNPALRWVP